MLGGVADRVSRHVPHALRVDRLRSVHVWVCGARVVSVKAGVADYRCAAAGCPAVGRTIEPGGLQICQRFDKFLHAKAGKALITDSLMPNRTNLEDAAQDMALMARALSWNELFSRWPQRYRDELMKSARLQRYSRRTQVLAHDRLRRELLAVVSGCLEISSISVVGRKYVNALLGPGQVAPLLRLLEDVPLPYDYHAHEESVIIHLPSDAVLAVLDAEPALWRDVARLGLQRQRLSVAFLRVQMLSSVRRRIAATLLNLAQIYGQQRDAGLDLCVRLSQNDLASMLGVSRQTVNKELGVLVEAGVIALSYKRVTVRDEPQLRRIVALGLDEAGDKTRVVLNTDRKRV